MALGRPKVALILTDDERVRVDSLVHRSRTGPPGPNHPGVRGRQRQQGGGELLSRPTYSANHAVRTLPSSAH